MKRLNWILLLFLGFFVSQPVIGENIMDNNLRLGDRTDTDKTIYGITTDTTPPFLRFDFSALEWVYSDDGSTIFELGAPNMTAKGDILSHDGSDACTLAAGTDGYGLVRSAAATCGLAWAAVLTNPLTGNFALDGELKLDQATNTSADALRWESTGGISAYSYWSSDTNFRTDYFSSSNLTHQLLNSDSGSFSLKLEGLLGVGVTPTEEIHIEGVGAGPTIRLQHSGSSLNSPDTNGVIEFYSKDASDAGAGVKSSIRSNVEGPDGTSALEFRTSSASANNVVGLTIDKTQSVKIPGNIKGQAFTISDDAVQTLTPTSDIGMMLLLTRNTSGYPNIWGFFAYQSGTLISLTSGSDVEVNNSALTGTTGTDNKVTVGNNGGTIYIENRRGGGTSLSALFFGE